MSNVLESVWGSDGGQPTWSKGWSRLVPLTIAGAPYLFIYAAANGAVGIGRLRPGGAGFDWPYGSWTGAANVTPMWSRGWSHFVPLTLGGASYLFIYKADEGAVGLGRVQPGGAGFDWPFCSWAGAASWSPGWSHFVPFTLGGAQYLFLYCAENGAVGIGRVRPDGSGFDWPFGSWAGAGNVTERWSPGWSHFVPFTLDGAQYLFLYCADNGAVGIGRVRPDGSGFDWPYGSWQGADVTTPPWAPGWSHVLLLEAGGAPRLFLYNPKDGAAGIGRVADGGKGFGWEAGSWMPGVEPMPAGLTHFAPLAAEGAVYPVYYDALGGGVGVLGFAPGLFNLFSPKRRVFGIDVSHHQAPRLGELPLFCHVDWRKVYDCGRIKGELVRFACIKVTGHYVVSTSPDPQLRPRAASPARAWLLSLPGDDFAGEPDEPRPGRETGGGGSDRLRGGCRSGGSSPYGDRGARPRQLAGCSGCRVANRQNTGALCKDASHQAAAGQCRRGNQDVPRGRGHSLVPPSARDLYGSEFMGSDRRPHEFPAASVVDLACSQQRLERHLGRAAQDGPQGAGGVPGVGHLAVCEYSVGGRLGVDRGHSRLRNGNDVPARGRRQVPC